MSSKSRQNHDKPRQRQDKSYKLWKLIQNYRHGGSKYQQIKSKIIKTLANIIKQYTPNITLTKTLAKT